MRFTDTKIVYKWKDSISTDQGPVRTYIVRFTIHINKRKKDKKEIKERMRFYKSHGVPITKIKNGSTVLLFMNIDNIQSNQSYILGKSIYGLYNIDEEKKGIIRDAVLVPNFTTNRRYRGDDFCVLSYEYVKPNSENAYVITKLLKVLHVHIFASQKIAEKLHQYNATTRLYNLDSKTDDGVYISISIHKLISLLNDKKAKDIHDILYDIIDRDTYLKELIYKYKKNKINRKEKEKE